MAWLLFLVLCVLFLTAYAWGHHDGREKGYGAGYVEGNNAAIEKMKPTGAVRVVPPQR